MKTLTNLLALISAVILVTGCDKPASPSGGPGTGAKLESKAEGITPARKTSFAEVTSQLDPNGSVYGYLATDQWLAGLSTNLAEWRGLLDSVPDVSVKDREKIGQVFNVLTTSVRESGIEDLTGAGLSGIQITPELFRTKFILHHQAGKGDGFMWNLMGKAPHALTGMNLLSTNTALATFGDFDAKLLWEVLDSELGKSGVPELADGIRQWPALFEKQTKLSWSKVLESFGGEAGLVVTLNEQQKISLPLGGGMELSEPGVMLVLKVNDDLLYNRITTEMKKTSMAKLTDEKDLKMCVMPVPIPLPVELQVTVASSGGYLFVASSPSLVRDALAVRAGTQPGLAKTADFAVLLKYLPTEGNQFTYVDRRVAQTVAAFQKQSLKSGKMNPKQQQLLDKLLFSRKAAYGLSIGAHTATGWQGVTVGNQDASTSLIAAPAVVASAVGAAMVLPALAKAKERAQSINCVNNMKQIGLSFRIWAGDNGDKFPFNVSKEQGGTLEYCDRGSDGYDHSAYRIFQVMSNELSTPKILVCPADSVHTVAANFATLQAGNVSYQVRSGERIDETNPQEVLVYCPVHHHKCLADGSVQMGNKGQ